MSGPFPAPPGLETSRVAPTRGPAPAWPEPYRILFPLGVAFAVAGAAPWLAAAFGSFAWPGPLHMTLMIEGFEQSFVIGFLFTAMPAFTRGARCRPWESGAAAGLLAAFAFFTFAGPAWAAHLAYAATLVLVAQALASRVVRSRHLPPEEFLFVALGLLLGLAGVAVLVAEQAFGWAAPAPRLGERLLSLGMTLSVVLGVGGLLVPTFAGMRQPLHVPGVAGPHQRRGRRRLFVPVALGLVAAFVLEALAFPWPGAIARASAATLLLVLVWKVWRRPRIAGLLPRALWASGWLVLAGLWLAVFWPAQTTAAYHVVFLGGYGLLTLGIGTRVTVAHGGHPFADERRVLTPVLVSLLGLALLARLAAAVAPAGAAHAQAASAALWMLAWALWAAQALPRLMRLASPVRAQPVASAARSRP